MIKVKNTAKNLIFILYGLKVLYNYRTFAMNFKVELSNNRRAKGASHKRRKDNIMLTFGIATIVAAVLAEVLIVSKKINLD